MNDLLHLIKNENIFRHNIAIETNNKEYIEITLKRLLMIINIDLINIFDLEKDPKTFIQVMNILHQYDLSLAVKTGVNFGLFGGSILRLGSDKQKKIISYINNGSILGCLAITEIGHGSNLKSLETTATWNNNNKTFIINSPSLSSHKYWIGNATHANFTVVYAQLYMNNKCLGLHPFLVPLKYNKSTIKILPEYYNSDKIKKMHYNESYIYKDVNIKLIERKGGLNGIDNGEIYFDNVEIPRNNLLTKFGYINCNGEYITSHKNMDKRFGELLSTLSGGRGTLALGANQVTLKTVNMMYYYASTRRQFKNDKNDKENTILSYTPVSNRIIYPLVKHILLQTALNSMLELGIKDFKNTNKISKEMHSLSSGLKIYSSELAFNTCDEARLLFAGHGYLYMNQIVKMRGDIDIWRTFEGDNNLLRQEVVKCSLELLNKNPDRLNYICNLIGKENIGSYVSIQEFNNNMVKTTLKLLSLKHDQYLSLLFSRMINDIPNNDSDSFKVWTKHLNLINKISNLNIELSILNCSKDKNDRITKLFALNMFNKHISYFLANNIIDKETFEMLNEKEEEYVMEIKLNLDNLIKKYKVDKIFYPIPIFDIIKSKL